MHVKFLSGDLNLNSYPPHSTNTYTCRMTTAPEAHDEKKIRLHLLRKSFKWLCKRMTVDSEGSLPLTFNDQLSFESRHNSPSEMSISFTVQNGLMLQFLMV